MIPRTRTDPELRTAVDSMFRIRAVESPPDPEGSRTIWHRGAKGADLITLVDAVGKVARQELTLFDDYFLWVRGEVLKTGAISSTAVDRLAPSPYEVTFDGPGQSFRAERLQRSVRALGSYQGSDRYLQHVRELLRKAMQGEHLESEEPVTRSADRVLVDEAMRELDQQRGGAAPDAAMPAEPDSRLFIYAAGGAFVAFVAAAVAYLLFGL